MRFFVAMIAELLDGYGSQIRWTLLILGSVLSLAIAAKAYSTWRNRGYPPQVIKSAQAMCDNIVPIALFVRPSDEVSPIITLTEIARAQAYLNVVRMMMSDDDIKSLVKVCPRSMDAALQTNKQRCIEYIGKACPDLRITDPMEVACSKRTK